MATNKELTELLSSELGVNIQNRRPHANEIFKWQDLDLLPHSSTDTLLCEIFEWNGRNWRSTGNNLIGFLFSGDALERIKKQLISIPKNNALIPDFEFTKTNLLEFGLGIPSLFNIGIKGNISNAKDFSIKVNGVTKSRITNIDAPGIEILRNFSAFTLSKTKTYRKNVKFNYLSTALFYAESVEILLEKEAATDLEISFGTAGVSVEAIENSATKKNFKLTYSGNQAPFAAKFTKGKDFDIS
ncbi:hypothetical protein [Chryseobacterium sp.]|uniref:hypothetical protein n=1 Tax=Chryseobacterium sp. TaxID=1871047 RepID=UPI0011C9B122|nr:hypothetical protein [Chryseobacterium sp.]TXF77735.1 hypothetical protein FUA25_07375 [Chryseobacterium sp.]